MVILSKQGSSKSEDNTIKKLIITPMNKVQKIKSRRTKAGILFVLLFVLCLKANAQFDPMFTQYMNNEMFINPAYTGTRKVLVTTLLYRNQWVGIEGSPKTQTFSLHSPTSKKCGVGISVMNESIGISRTLRLNGNYSYRIRTSEKGQLSFGLQGGIIQYHQNYNELVLVNPNDNLFNSNLSNAIAPNAGFGMFYYTNRFYLGFSIPRMIKNSFKSSGFQNSASPKDWHYYLTSAIVLNVSDNFKLKPSVMIKEVYGAPIQGELAIHGLFDNVWWIGASYRTGDAISVITGFQLSNQLRIFYSYDYTLTALQNYSSGSHEIVISYDFAVRNNRIASPRIF